MMSKQCKGYVFYHCFNFLLHDFGIKLNLVILKFKRAKNCSECSVSNIENIFSLIICLSFMGSIVEIFCSEKLNDGYRFIEVNAYLW